MSEFSWVPFAEELLNKIITTSSPEKLYVEFRKLFDKPTYEDINKIDPLTYICSIFAGTNIIGKRAAIAKEVFELKANIPTDIDGVPNFPNGNYIYLKEIYKGRSLDEVMDKLWMFAQSVNENNIDSNLFNTLLDFDNIKIGKLSQFIYICKPQNYYSCDSTMLNFLNNSIELKDYSSFVELQKICKSKNLLPYQLSKKAWDYIQNHKSENSLVDIKDDQEIIKDEINIPLNQILYGPPGTGKTYNTANLALKILEPDFNSNNRDEIMAKYNDYKKNKQIQFVTFHQAYSYEEFVEGIRPILDDKSSELKYQIHNGIFKNIVELAKSEYAKAQVEANIDFSNINIYKMSLGNTLEKDDVNIFDYCIENNCIALGYGENEDFSNGNSKDEIKNIFQNSEKLKNETLFTVDAIDRFKNGMKIGDLVFISNGNTSVRAIGQITGDYYFKDDSEIRFCQFRNVQWLYNDINIPVDKFLNKNLSQQTIYQFFKDDLKFDYISALLTGEKSSNEIKKYVLVIDEINRGEIAKIFGELITLIEDTKRDNLDVILPYSNKSFSIPKNLYIIGTMNTADRSIALLDIALRRRFDFIAKYPDSNIIGKDGASTEINGINLKLFLDKMNERIEVLLDKDHTIGHSYLMGIKNYDDFIYKFKNRILPLLQEYFYNDYDNIAKVLNQDNIDDSEWNNKEDKIILKYCGIDDRPKYQINEDFPIQAFLKVCK